MCIVALAALAVGVGAAVTYYVHDLTLTMRKRTWSSRGVLSTRWSQDGCRLAVWLPLPHVLNLLPVQVDTLYRTGLSAVAFSVIAFVIGAVSLWDLVARVTGSPLAGWTAFAVFAAHPDVLYLQATPMTEALLMGLSCSVLPRYGHGLFKAVRGAPFFPQ